jgi:hypothetical protein
MSKRLSRSKPSFRFTGVPAGARTGGHLHVIGIVGRVNDEWLLVLLELFREPLDDRLIKVLVEVLPRDIVPMKSIVPEATCTPEAAGVAATG